MSKLYPSTKICLSKVHFRPKPDIFIPFYKPIFSFSFQTNTASLRLENEVYICYTADVFFWLTKHITFYLCLRTDCHGAVVYIRFKIGSLCIREISGNSSYAAMFWDDNDVNCLKWPLLQHCILSYCFCIITCTTAEPQTSKQISFMAPSCFESSEERLLFLNSGFQHWYNWKLNAGSQQRKAESHFFANIFFYTKRENFGILFLLDKS